MKYLHGLSLVELVRAFSRGEAEVERSLGVALHLFQLQRSLGCRRCRSRHQAQSLRFSKQAMTEGPQICMLRSFVQMQLHPAL